MTQSGASDLRRLVTADLSVSKKISGPFKMAIQHPFAWSR